VAPPPRPEEHPQILATVHRSAAQHFIDNDAGWKMVMKKKRKGDWCVLGGRLMA
jgi:hypothetical protein